MFDCPCTAQFCIEIDYSNRFRLKNKIKSLVPRLILLIYLDQKPVIKFAWPYGHLYENLHLPKFPAIRYLAPLGLMAHPAMSSGSDHTKSAHSEGEWTTV